MTERKRRRDERCNSDDMMELGRTAIKGVVLVGTTAVAASLVGNLIGGLPPK